MSADSNCHRRDIVVPGCGAARRKTSLHMPVWSVKGEILPRALCDVFVKVQYFVFFKQFCSLNTEVVPLKICLQVLRRWGRMCWSLVAPKMLECPSQCCCTLIASMNAPGVSVFVFMCVHMNACLSLSVQVGQHCNMTWVPLFVCKIILHHLGFPWKVFDVFCHQDVTNNWRALMTPHLFN